MRVVKQVIFELYNDVRKYIFPFLWNLVKWISIIIAATFALAYLSYGYEQLGATGEAGALFAVLTVMGLIAIGTWVFKAYSRAKDKVSAQNKQLLATIADSTQSDDDDIDRCIRRIRIQRQGNTP